MALVVTDDKHYKAIADKMRQLYNTEDKFFPKDMAQNIEDLYNEAYMFGTEEGEQIGFDTGYDAGYDLGYEYGFSEGADSEYNTFWDAYQKNGTRTNYNLAYAGQGWVSGTTYNPKYHMQPTTAVQMFYGSTLTSQDIAEIDFSKCTDYYQTFAYSTLTEIGADMSLATRTTQAFISCRYLHTLKITSSQSTPYASTFNILEKLENLEVNGVIGQNGFDVSSSTLLTRDSLMSIINALKDFSGTNTTRTVKLGATNLAKLTDAEKAQAVQKGWSLA